MKPQPPRTPSRLPDSVHHQLNMYALAASAAGVGMLALAQPAEAKIVYTPAHKWLPVNQYFYLDLNHDGRRDFRFFLGSWWSSRSDFGYGLTVRPGTGPGAKENAVYSFRSQPPFFYCGKLALCAAALPEGVKVGPLSPFSPNTQFMFLSAVDLDSALALGQWLDETGQAYLGLKFMIKGKTHYGWARLGHISHNKPVKAELTGYAYETIPNKAIITGRTKGADVITVQPASLGRLARGSARPAAWRSGKQQRGTQAGKTPPKSASGVPTLCKSLG